MPIDWFHQTLKRISCVLAVSCLVCGCDDTSSPNGPTTQLDIPDIGDGTLFSDTDEAPEPDATFDSEPEPVEPPLDAETHFDIFLEDSFDRGDEPDSDSEPEPEPDPNPEPDVPDPTEINGSSDCLSYTMRVDLTTFTLKEDVIYVYYEVHNICNFPIHLRTQHESDFFSIAILQDGEPWVLLAEPNSCPNTGPITDFILNPGDGWVRGWFWRPENHEERLMQCGVSYDRNASYSIAGYGMEPISGNNPNAFSDTFILTEPIEILLVQ